MLLKWARRYDLINGEEYLDLTSEIAEIMWWTKELERIYGIKNGNHKSKDCHCDNPKTQEEALRLGKGCSNEQTLNTAKEVGIERCKTYRKFT